MIGIPGYQLVAKLGEGPQSVVYRGFERTAPDRPLVIKVFKTTSLTERQRAHFRQKVEHLRVLRDPALITPHAFDVRGGIPFLVQDYFDALPLDEWARQQPTPSLGVFFTIACHLATALDKVHEAGIIHGGVKPHNILVDPTTLETRLTGFVTPLDVRDVSHFIYDPAFVSGTLAYTSPEQTGRIHHVVVFSSDLYSLGIVFYELLTSRLPFRSTDPLALIHQHLAEEAPPVHEVTPQIPATLGRMVAKLILKHPEKRYQSGRGLLADLIRCRTEWEVGRTIGRFPLATQDRSRRVVFISKMVGREAESRAVLDAYEPATRGEFRAVFISGMPGIGKTRLIQELQQPIVRHRGYFTSGKFDVYQKNIPYSSITQALRSLIRAFLTESQERVAAWRRRILEAVGQNGQVLIDVLPELEALIGPQPAVSPLPPVEARNRFHGLFDRFLGCLASAESPLTLFIDDLQWCDVASFDFLETVFANPEEHPHLLLLGAYRHTEVDGGHPLAKLIAKVKAGAKPLVEIRLGPLEPKHCHEMVSYVLDAPLSHTGALADFLGDLTEGNPLFVSESLSYLYNEDLLYVDDDLEWRWDLDRIRSSHMPSTVVALFSAKIGKLPSATVDLLETCACMGNTVAPEDLSRVRDLALPEIFESLKPALGQGLVIENRGNLQFIHDRVQEAVLTGIPAERRRAIHWRAGQRLLAAAPAGADLEALDNLFAIVSHLNLGRPEPLHRADALRLADVNFHAGEKALNALATEAANGFFATSKGLLPADCWEVEYDKTFTIYRKAAKTELMCGRSEQSEVLLAELLEHARTDLDKAEALAEQTTSLSSIGNFVQAIETGNRGLAYFGKAIPDDPAEADRRRNALTAEIASRGDIWQAILGMPTTMDRKSRIELALYSELVPDLYLAGRVPQLYLTAAQSTEHCLSGGMDDSVIYAFCAMGLMHAEREEFELSFRYEDLVRDLAARYPNTFGATRGLNGNAWVLTHTRGRPDEVVEVCLKSLLSGKNCGDLYTAGLSYAPLMWTLQVQGADFGAIEEYARECRRFSERYNLAFSAGLAEAMQAGWLAPMKTGYEPVPMEERVARWEKDNHVAAAGSYYLHLALSHYYFGEHERAAETLAETKRYLAGLSESVIKRQWHVFAALNALKLHDQASDGDRQAVLAEIAPLVAKIETWARLGPLLRPYLAFLYAERERVAGGFERARSLYLDAIGTAHDQGYVFLEGHLNECLGAMLLATGRGPARVYLAEAARLYRRCRAQRKELRLRERYPACFEEEAFTPAAAPVEAPEATPYALPQLDVAYLMRSALAISAEIEQEALLHRIMQTVIECSGAQHGYLLLAEGSHLRVRAESHVGGGEPVRTVDRRLEDAVGVCKAVVRYVFRTGQRLVLADAGQDGEFKDTPEVRALGLRSVLCLPILKQARLVGVLYLENRLSPAVFTPTGTQTTELLMAQAAISLENARLVEEMKRAQEGLRSRERELSELTRTLEQRVRERTAELDRTNRTLRMISECNQVLARTTEERELVQQICHLLVEMGGFRMAWVGYAHDDEPGTVRPVAVDGVEPGLLQLCPATWSDSGTGCNPAGECVRSGRVRVVPDLTACPATCPSCAEALRRGFGSLIALPLASQGNPFGALTIFSETPDAFDAAQVAVLEELTNDMAYGITALRAKAERDQAHRISARRAEQLRALATELVQTEQRQRQRLAKLLHDHLQQLLVGAKFSLSSLARTEAVREGCQQVTDALDEAIQVARSLSAELIPPVLQEKGLAARLEWLAGYMQQKHGLLVDMDADGTDTPLAQHLRTFLFEAVRELLFNVVKHAQVSAARVRCAWSEGEVVVTVEDDGVGFDVGRLEEGTGAETGFGLFSIRERAGYLGGRLASESSPGHGSRFTLFVPLSLAPAEHVPLEGATAGNVEAVRQAASVEATPGEGREIRVLLVDDHPVVRQSLARLLEDQPGIVVVGEAGDGKAGVELARALRPDVVVMDISMPVMDGLAATRAIGSDLPSIAVVGLSMHEDPAMEAAIRAAGATHFVTKGGPSNGLVSAIYSAVGHRHEQPGRTTRTR